MSSSELSPEEFIEICPSPISKPPAPVARLPANPAPPDPALVRFMRENWSSLREEIHNSGLLMPPDGQNLTAQRRHRSRAPNTRSSRHPSAPSGRRPASRIQRHPRGADRPAHSAPSRQRRFPPPTATVSRPPSSQAQPGYSSGDPRPAAPSPPIAAIRPVPRSSPAASATQEEPHQQTSIFSPVTAEELAEHSPTPAPEFTMEEEDPLLGFNLFQSPRPPTPPRPNPQPHLAHRQEEDMEMVDLTAPTPAPHPSPDAVPAVPLPPARPHTRMVRDVATQTSRRTFGVASRTYKAQGSPIICTGSPPLCTPRQRSLRHTT
nr:PREDICTED: extensin-like [Bemisia tabaci]